MPPITPNNNNNNNLSVGDSLPADLFGTTPSPAPGTGLGDLLGDLPVGMPAPATPYMMAPNVMQLNPMQGNSSCSYLSSY